MKEAHLQTFPTKSVIFSASKSHFAAIKLAPSTFLQKYTAASVLNSVCSDRRDKDVKSNLCLSDFVLEANMYKCVRCVRAVRACVRAGNKRIEQQSTSDKGLPQCDMANETVHPSSPCSFQKRRRLSDFLLNAHNSFDS